jgi:hypothetical protein
MQFDWPRAAGDVVHCVGVVEIDLDGKLASRIEVLEESVILPE